MLCIFRVCDKLSVIHLVLGVRLVPRKFSGSCTESGIFKNVTRANKNAEYYSSTSDLKRFIEAQRKVAEKEREVVENAFPWAYTFTTQHSGPMYHNLWLKVCLFPSITKPCVLCSKNELERIFSAPRMSSRGFFLSVARAGRGESGLSTVVREARF